MRKFTTAGIFTQKCDIYERADTRVGTQPVAPTPILRASSVDCRIYPVSSQEQTTLIGRMVQASHRLLLNAPAVPPGFDVEWEVVEGSSHYRIAESPKDAGGAGEIITCLALKVRAT
jgi:hypothetical protein